MESLTLIERFWSSLSTPIFTLTAYEKALGYQTVGVSVASFFTLAVFFTTILDVIRAGDKWITGVARGIIKASWIFPLLYLPYQGAPLWIALFFGSFMWLGSWVLLRKIAIKRRPSSKVKR